MSRLQSAFAKTGRKALVAYVTVGYPDVDTTLRLVPLLAQNGCDVIELGIPFSDPLADGATIQHASHVALENAVTPGVCLDAAAKLSHTTDAPLVFMSYYNPVLRRGLDSFCADAAGAGWGVHRGDRPVTHRGHLQSPPSHVRLCVVRGLRRQAARPG